MGVLDFSLRFGFDSGIGGGSDAVCFVDGRRLRLLCCAWAFGAGAARIQFVDAGDDAVELLLQTLVGADVQIAAQQRIERMSKCCLASSVLPAWWLANPAWYSFSAWAIRSSTGSEAGVCSGEIDALAAGLARAQPDSEPPALAELVQQLEQRPEQLAAPARSQVEEERQVSAPFGSRMPPTPGRPAQRSGHRGLQIAYFSMRYVLLPAVQICSFYQKSYPTVSPGSTPKRHWRGYFRHGPIGHR